MQIISGIYKNKPLKAPDAPGTHPMGSREKLALFNMLMPYLSNATVLDAFSGTGALGLEALSRGASSVTLVEKSPKAARIIKENLAAVGNDSRAKLLVTDVKNLGSAYDLAENFDLIIADPPYDHFEPALIESLVPLLKKSGILALSHPGLSPEFAGLKLLKSHTYAAATISIYCALK